VLQHFPQDSLLWKWDGLSSQVGPIWPPHPPDRVSAVMAPDYVNTRSMIITVIRSIYYYHWPNNTTAVGSRLLPESLNSPIVPWGRNSNIQYGW
jgi:hypothetical protein